jgi:hypothetical protein
MIAHTAEHAEQEQCIELGRVRPQNVLEDALGGFRLACLDQGTGVTG